MNKKGQVGPREMLILFGVIILLIIFLPIISTFINSISTGNVDSLVNALIPILIFAVFFSFLRRFLG